METQKIGQTLVKQKRIGNLFLKEFLFDKMLVFRDKDGQVKMEKSFQETVFLIVSFKQAIWLKPEQLRDLKNLLDDEEASSSQPGTDSSQLSLNSKEFGGE